MLVDVSSWVAVVPGPPEDGPFVRGDGTQHSANCAGFFLCSLLFIVVGEQQLDLRN
jgi:hypothetical protein